MERMLQVHLSDIAIASYADACLWTLRMRKQTLASQTFTMCQLQAGSASCKCEAGLVLLDN